MQDPESKLELMDLGDAIVETRQGQPYPQNYPDYFFVMGSSKVD